MFKKGNDITKAYETIWNGKPMYVKGTGNTNEKLNQFWIDKQKLIVVKFIKYNGQNKEKKCLVNM